MMNIKYLLFLISYLLVGPDLNAQDDCTPVYKLFNTGRAKVWHSTAGEFWKAPNGNGFEIVDDALSAAPVQVSREAGLWIIGKDDGGNMKGSLPEPVGRGWHPGPLNEDGESTSDLCNNYNKIWEVTLDDLIQHQADLADNGIIDGPIPDNIKAWPGNNNSLFEEANGFEYLYGLELAPFFDYGDNGVPDGNYNPEKGDFPYIKELRINQHPVLMQWWVINDIGVNGGFPNPIQMQIQITAFSLDRPCIESTSIFYDLKMVNMAVEPINDLRIGFWMTPGLGCLENDYFGTDPQKNLAFVYNGDDEDTDDNCICETEETGFCNESSMFGLATILGPLDDNFQQIGFSSISYFDNNPNAPLEMQPPKTFDAYTNYLMGKWADGSPITTYGNGLNPSGYDSTSYVFSDRPSESEGWSMCTATDIDQIDPTILFTYDNLALWPLSRSHLIFVVMATAAIKQEACGPIDELLNQLNDNIDKFELHEVFVDPCAPLPPPPPPEIMLEVFPNPASEFVIIKPKKGKQLKEVRLIDTSGRIINAFENIQEDELRIENPQMNGIFFIQIITTDNEKSTHKIFFHT